MVQHVLLLLLAAPLLALSAPFATLVRDTPLFVRRAAARWGRPLHRAKEAVRPLLRPAAVWLLHVGTLWFWHASIPYGAALENEAVHVLEHASFLITALLFWQAVFGAPARRRASHGFGALLVFTAAMQSVLLSALLTFAQTPWYPSYAQTTRSWGLTPLADQQLAGVIMWIPAGLLYVAVALALLVAWIGSSEAEEAPLQASPRAVPPPGVT